MDVILDQSQRTQRDQWSLQKFSYSVQHIQQFLSTINPRFKCAENIKSTPWHRVNFVRFGLVSLCLLPPPPPPVPCTFPGHPGRVKIKRQTASKAALPNMCGSQFYLWTCSRGGIYYITGLRGRVFGCGLVLFFWCTWPWCLYFTWFCAGLKPSQFWAANYSFFECLI